MPSTVGQSLQTSNSGDGFPYSYDVGVNSIPELTMLAESSGLQFSVTSAYRPGAVTHSGNRSLHATHNAIDIVASMDTMYKLAAYLYQFSPFIMELIHSDVRAQGKGFYVKNGQRVPWTRYGQQLVDEHYNHVHLASTKSAMIAAEQAGRAGGSGGNATARAGQGNEIPMVQNPNSDTPIPTGISCGLIIVSGLAGVATNLLAASQIAGHLF